MISSSSLPAAAPGIPDLPAALTGAVTGIGSLPFLSAETAVKTVAECCPEVPFWPQLPSVSEQESIIGQGLGVLTGLLEPRAEGYGYQVKEGRIEAVIRALHGSTGELNSTHAAGFCAFGEALDAGVFASATALKGQIEGPVTLAAYLFYKGRPFLSDALLFAAVAFHISQIACRQIERLQSAGLPVLMFLDEPALCLNDAIAHAVPQERRLSAIAAIFETVRSRGASAGLHCCAERPFERMCLARPDILSFDAHLGLEEFFTDGHALEFIRNGGWVAYGMIPTLPGLDLMNPAALFSRWLSAASLAGDPPEFARRAMVTSTCGLGLLTPSAVEKSFELARRTGRLLRRLAGR